MTLPTYLQQKDMARECGIAPRTLADWEKRGIVPQGRRVGGVKLYHTKTVFAAIEHGGAKAVECIDPISARIRNAPLAASKVRPEDQDATR